VKLDLKDLPAERYMPPARLQARQQAVERFAKAPAPRRRVTRVTARVVALVAGILVLVMGGTAVAYVAFMPATVPVANQTRCYTKASVGEGDDFYGTTVGQALSAGSNARKAEAAVDICSSLWRQGILKLDSKQVGFPAENRTDYLVPSLVACRLENGIAAVFPGDEMTCSRLGLPRLAE
jgi:hypothetical protein